MHVQPEARKEKRRREEEEKKKRREEEKRTTRTGTQRNGWFKDAPDRGEKYRTLRALLGAHLFFDTKVDYSFFKCMSIV